MYRFAPLMWAALLLLGPSPCACGESNSLAGLPVGRSYYDTPTSARRPTIYTPAYAPVYDGIYTPANAPPLTRTYVPAYARTPAYAPPHTRTYAPGNVRPPAYGTTPTPKVVYPEPTEEAGGGESRPDETPPAPPGPAEDKPTLKPRKQTGYRPVQETDSATIILNVSGTATVWINGRKTTSRGTHRKYTSVGLLKGSGYRYRIVVQDGDQQAESEVVLTAGETRLVRWPFSGS